MDYWELLHVVEASAGDVKLGAGPQTSLALCRHLGPRSLTSTICIIMT